MSNQLTVVRAIHDKQNPFTRLSNKFIADKRLSAKAKGVFCYLLSLQDDWAINPKEICNHFSDGVEVIRSAITELIEFGYITYTQNKGQNGRFQEAKYVRHEIPKNKIVNNDTLENRGLSPRLAFPDTVAPDTKNPTLLTTQEQTTNCFFKETNKQGKNKLFDQELEKVVVCILEKIGEGGRGVTENTIRQWIKQYRGTYILEKVELVKSIEYRCFARALNAAIKKDWKAGGYKKHRAAFNNHSSANLLRAASDSGHLKTIQEALLAAMRQKSA